jgi:hypothetical protein
MFEWPQREGIGVEHYENRGSVLGQGVPPVWATGKVGRWEEVSEKGKFRPDNLRTVG